MVEAISFIVANKELILQAVSALLAASIAIALVVPGDQPEKTLQAIVDFIEKFSKK